MLIRRSDTSIESGGHGQPRRVILRGGAVPGVTQVAEAAFDEPVAIETHVHPTMYEFFYVVEGCGEYVVGEEKHAAGPGDLVVVPPGVPHAVTARAGHRIFYWGLAV